MASYNTASIETLSYRELVSRTAKDIPTFYPLNKFLQNPKSQPHQTKWAGIKCKLRFVKFCNDRNAHPHGHEYDSLPPTVYDPIELTENSKDQLEALGKQLRDLKDPDVKGHHLLLVENLIPSVVELLGDNWLVPPNYFLSHLENSNWYSMQNIPQNLPVLTSIQSELTYVRFQFIGPREFVQKPDSKLRLPDRIKETREASVRRIAGGFMPREPPQEEKSDYSNCDDSDSEDEDEGFKPNPVAFVRNSITVWFDQTHGDWHKGIILFDPPFDATENAGFGKKQISNYRSFIERLAPPHYDSNHVDDRASYKESFVKCLEVNKHVHGVPHPFLLLSDLYHIIASEWAVFNTYIERELNNIERWYEVRGEKCDEKSLHDLLSQLMVARRKVTKYEALINDQLQFCPKHWCLNPDEMNDMADFRQALEKIGRNKERIAQALQVATSLMAVRLNGLVVVQNDRLVQQTDKIVTQTTVMNKQNSLASARNKSLNFLTQVATVFLPFGAIASVMSIPASIDILGPSGKNAWIFWTTVPIIASALIATFYLIQKHETEKVKVQEREVQRRKSEENKRRKEEAAQGKSEADERRKTAAAELKENEDVQAKPDMPVQEDDMDSLRSQQESSEVPGKMIMKTDSWLV